MRQTTTSDMKGWQLLGSSILTQPMVSAVKTHGTPSTNLCGTHPAVCQQTTKQELTPARSGPSWHARNTSMPFATSASAVLQLGIEPRSRSLVHTVHSLSLEINITASATQR